MRILIISDVHANLPALNAVLADAGRFESVWCLGDIVGYGPDPNACVEKIAALPQLQCVKGNHDAAILGEIPIETFNLEAQASLSWLKTELTTENKHWLAALDEQVVVGDVTLVHGSPRNPVWEYMLSQHVARDNMDKFSTMTCLVGHTHFPCVFQRQDDASATIQQFYMVETMPYVSEQKAIINPGSVGQPRDRDPRAAYMIFDDESHAWTYYRVAYEIGQVQARILHAGLPERHANRLASGW